MMLALDRELARINGLRSGGGGASSRIDEDDKAESMIVL